MRPATPEEHETFDRFMNGIEKGLARQVRAQAMLYVNEDSDSAERTAVLLAPEAGTLPAALLEDAWSAGLPIGAFDEEGFTLGLQGAVHVADVTDSYTVRVGVKATNLFLYGRNIFGSSVERYDRRLRVGDGCIVTDVRGEAIGIGEVVGRFKGQGEAVRCVHDLGAYLREQ